ncbi:MAG: hypothetical protein AB7G75_24270 [Candidatus Binatia bacterium]
MYTLLGFLVASVLVGIGVWRYAYQLGLKHGQATSVPFRLIDELLDHKIHCCGEDPAIARVEVEAALGIEEWEPQSLLQQAQRSPRSRETDITPKQTESQTTR